MLNIRGGPHLGFNHGRLLCAAQPLSWGTGRGKLVYVKRCLECIDLPRLDWTDKSSINSQKEKRGSQIS